MNYTAAFSHLRARVIIISLCFHFALPEATPPCTLLEPQ